MQHTTSRAMLPVVTNNKIEKPMSTWDAHSRPVPLHHLYRSYCEQKELYKSTTVPTNQNGKPHIVVFDAPGALKSFLRPAKRGLLYDFHQQQQKVRSMVRAFKQQGYELVVFLDCNIPDDKLTTWYRRRSVSHQHCAASFARLPAGRTLQRAGVGTPGTLLQLC